LDAWLIAHSQGAQEDGFNIVSQRPRDTIESPYNHHIILKAADQAWMFGQSPDCVIGFEEAGEIIHGSDNLR
jgi:hypothetical protein